MKLLLDECVPIRLRHWIVGHEVRTTRFTGMTTLRNGELLRRAAELGYDALITIDQSMPYQHDIENLPLSIVILDCLSNEPEKLRGLIPEPLIALRKLQPRSVIVVNENGSSKFVK